MKKIYSTLIALFVLSNVLAQDNPPFFTGMVFDDDAYSKTMMKAPLTRSTYGASLPASASMKKYCPTPKNQGNYGTCVGWSSTYAALTIINAIKNNWTDKAVIDQNTFSPWYTYTQIRLSTTDNCANGTYINDAMGILKNKGAVPYSEFNVECQTSVPSNLTYKAGNYKIKDFAKLFDTYDSENFKIQATKKSISENKPVVIGMKCPNSFYYPSGVWQPTEDPSTDFGGHAMCVIGYDDNMYGGAFEFMNSWGPTWANSGFVWVKYSDYAKFTKYAYEMIDDLKTVVVKNNTNNNNTNNVVVKKEIKLSGKLKFVLADGTEMLAKKISNFYRMEKAYKSGTKFRLYINNDQPAYVYAFGADLTHKTFQIFPHKSNISPALTYKSNNVALPDEDHYIEMDKTIGKDYLCVVYSKEPLKIDDLRGKVEKGIGSFHERIKTAFSSIVVDATNVKYLETGSIGFEASSKDKSVVLLVVETEHIQ